MDKKEFIAGVGINTESENKILEFIGNELQKPKRSREQIVVFTPNPEQIAAASKSASLKAILNQADIALPDGVGVVIASKLLGGQVRHRIAGVDFMKKVVKSMSKQPVKSGFFGGQPHVAERAAECLQKSYPHLIITYVSDVYDKEKMIHSDIDILFVALGFPKQEQWIIEHKNELPGTVIMAVGGAFDFISGRVPRAPKFLRTVGLEWLFRLTIQPWRVFRQARLLHFSALILREALVRPFKRL